MSKYKNARWLALSIFFLTGSAGAEHPVAEAQRHQQEATVAYQAGDYEGFTRSMELAHELNPASFATKYNLACGYARTGRADAALDLLEQLAIAQVDFGMVNDPDLASLREFPRFRAVVDLIESSIAPISNSTELLTINQLGLWPEGIAFDPDTKRLFFWQHAQWRYLRRRFGAAVVEIRQRWRHRRVFSHRYHGR